MTTKELIQWFDFIKEKDTLTVYCMLKDKRKIKEYKKTDFYKQTKISLVKAYILYNLNGFANLLALFNCDLIKELKVGNYNYLIVLIEDLIRNFDVESLNPILDYIGNSFNKINFTELENKIQSSVQNFKEKIKF